MVIKKKICYGCNKESFIYKNLNGNKYCKNCMFSMFPKPIKKISDKRQKENIEYSKLRKIFLDAHPFCAAKFEGICQNIATDIHHLHSGKDRSKHYLDVSTWKSICRNCHSFLHNNLSSKKAEELNLKLK